MKHLLYILFLLPLAAKTQGVKQVEFDVQSNQKLIESLPVALKTASDIRMDVSLRAVGPTFFLLLTGSGIGANSININEEAIFLLANDSTVTVRSTTIQGYDYDETGKKYKHEYALSQEDLENLSSQNVKGMRKYSVSGFDDIYFEDQNASNLKTLCASFLKELGKARLLKIRSSAPAFPGGRDVLLLFLNRNLKVLPPLKAGERKKALVQFQVEPDGSIRDIQVKQSAGAVYDSELLRILKRMPKWKPALEKGKKVKAVVAEQISFYQQDAKIKVQL